MTTDKFYVGQWLRITNYGSNFEAYVVGDCVKVLRRDGSYIVASSPRVTWHHDDIHLTANEVVPLRYVTW